MRNTYSDVLSLNFLALRTSLNPPNSSPQPTRRCPCVLLGSFCVLSDSPFYVLPDSPFMFCQTPLMFCLFPFVFCWFPFMFCRICNPAVNTAPIPVTHIVLVFCRICNPAVLSMRIYNPSIFAACGICSSACSRITNPDTLCRRIANPPEHGSEYCASSCNSYCPRSAGFVIRQC